MGFQSFFTISPLKTFYSDLTTPVVCYQELIFKHLAINLHILTCKENQTYGLERTTQINIWIYSTKTNHLLEICTK